VYGRVNDQLNLIGAQIAAIEAKLETVPPDPDDLIQVVSPPKKRKSKKRKRRKVARPEDVPVA